MKKILAVLAAFLFAFSLQAQDITEFLNKLEDTDGVQVASVNKEMFKLISAMDAEKDEEDLAAMTKLMEGLEYIKIYIYQNDTDLTLYKEARAAAQKHNMSELLATKQDGQRVLLFTDKMITENEVENLLLLVHDGEQDVFIRIKGMIDINALQEASDGLNFDGLEYLEKIGGAEDAKDAEGK